MTTEQKLAKLFEKGYVILEISAGPVFRLKDVSGACMSTGGVSVAEAVDRFYKEVCDAER